MDKKKLVILILVVVGVLAFMALGAGAYRGNRDPTPDPDKDPDDGVKVLDGATGWMRSSLDLERMVGDCNRSGRSIGIPGPCEIVIRPASARLKLPSEFKLRPVVGSVLLCFAPTRAMLEDCKAERDDLEPRRLEEEKRFTVAKDSAFLYFACEGGGSCGVEVVD
jgi:hypothetical protein